MKNKVKNQILTIAVLAIFALPVLPSPTQVFAVEGTCSWHGGINCYAGSDWDGSAICNDGWRDSDELYATAQICKINNCVRPTSNCTSEGEYAKLQSDLIRGGTMRYAPESAQGILSECRSGITAYQSYQSCLTNNQGSYGAQNQAQDQYLRNQIDYLERATKQLEEDRKKKEDDLQNTSCKNLNGTFSHYDSNYKKCFCDKSYVYTDGQCKSADSVCQNRIGDNSRASWAKDGSGSDVFSCACTTGYTLNASDKCGIIPKPTAKISERALNVAKSDQNSFRCDSSDLSDQEKSECGSYRLSSDKYSWEIYNKSTEAIPTPNQPQTGNATKPVSQELKTPEVPTANKMPIKKEPIKIEKKSENLPPQIKPALKPVKILTATTTATSTKVTNTNTKKESFTSRMFKKLKFW